jgi:hypothetical protein
MDDFPKSFYLNRQDLVVLPLIIVSLFIVKLAVILSILAFVRKKRKTSAD